jgi:hypothetical protein
MTAPLPEESNSSVYDYIAAKGYHFPDWLVTDYVLSLATKPLVILSGISGTGKTKMAQLVSEFVAPAQERESVRTGLPDLGDFSFAHSVGLATLRHNVITIPKSAAALLESLPAPGTSMPVKLRIEGLGEYSARLIGGAYGAANPAYQVRWKKDLQTALAGVVQSGDHLMVRVDSDAQVPAFDVVPVVAERATQTVPSERIAFLSVRPDWTDNRALLGYYNPLLQRYQGTELLRLLLRAQTNPDEPHFVVLDEMNLAKVEYYFSDFLSAMESETEMVLHDTDDEDVDLEMPLPPKRLKVPPNVFFTGTVNVDETTYMFSPKVLDRANTIEFNEVNLASYGAGGGLLDAFRLADSVTLDDLLAASRKPVPADWNGLPTPFKERVREVHALMAEYHLHFGYRVANEIARYLALTAEYIGDEQLDFAFDLQVLQKVLPKLSGSRAKLERPLEALLDYLDGAGLHLSAAKVARMLETVRTVGFVSFVE